MAFFKNIRLSMKLYIGFAAVMALLLMTAIVGFWGMRSNSSYFSTYRDIAVEQELAGRIQANLLSCRIAYKTLIETNDGTQEQVFNERYAKLEQFANEFKDKVDDKERTSQIDTIILHAKTYNNDFKRVIELHNKKEDIYGDTLGAKGTEMEEELSVLVETALKNNNQNTFYGASSARRYLLLGRLNAVKYLESNNANAATEVKKAFEEFDKWMKYFQNDTMDSSMAAHYNKILSDKEDYYTHFLSLMALNEEELSIIKQMDTIGPEISNIIEEIKLSIIEEENVYGPKAGRSIQNSVIAMIIITLIASLLSVIVSIGIVRLIILPVKTITDTFSAISEGETDLAVRIKNDAKDEIGQLSNYFDKFMDKLQVIFSDIKKQNLIKTGLAEVNETLRGEQEVETLTNNVITFICRFLNAQIGAIYMPKENDANHHFIAGYAFAKKTDANTQIASGEGLIGQCAIEKQIIVMSDVPEDYIKVHSGIGEAAPKHIMAVPCVLNGEIVCIIELGSFKSFEDYHIEFMTQIADSVAISINSTLSRHKMKLLLDKTIEQSEELQVQQEELRQTNEELEEQANALRISELQLKEQQEELRQTNEELEEQAKALRESEIRLQKQQEDLKAANEGLEERTTLLETQKQDIYNKNIILNNAQKDIEEKAKALEIASKYKSEFMANMSHELRTPLNSILVLSQMLSDKPESALLTQKDIEYAKTINSSGKDLLVLINDILDLSKVEAGKMDIVIEQTALSDIIEFANRTFDPIALNQGLAFNTQIDPNLPPYMDTDAMRLQQVIKNLLSNAFKFTNGGSVTLAIRRPSVEELGTSSMAIDETLCISIKDTGIGIPGDKQNIIFEAFKQSDGTTSRKYGGTGLGLSISKELSHLLGGFIHLDSVEGEGSTFSLILPEKANKVLNQSTYAPQRINPEENAFEPAEVLAAAAMEAPEELPAILESILDDDRTDLNENDKKLLIIEDDKNFHRLLKDMGREKGFKCLVATTGAGGLELAKAYTPDAIILDIGLPDIDGWEVVERLQSNKKTKNIPVHIISGYSNELGDIMKRSIAGYLRKPVDYAVLDAMFGDIEKLFNKPMGKMLIVGKSLEQSRSIAELFSEKKIETILADSGEEAIGLFMRERYDCLVTDLDLKDMSGYDFLNRIKGERLTATPIIIYTGKAISENEEHELQKYADSIIIKGSKSTERLLEEATLFLHGVDKKIAVTKKMDKWTINQKEELLKDKKILLVDDDMRNVFALSSVLESKGIKVVVGRNGREGLEKLESNQDIDLILMDVMMPEMDGYTAMRAIRAKDRWNSIPIIALTAKAMKEDRNKCIDAGANDYLTKPIDLEKFISLIRVWMYK